jgi:hypothetical protein
LLTLASPECNIDNSQGPVLAPPLVFSPPLFFIKTPLNNHSTSFFSSHISPHTPATHRRRWTFQDPRILEAGSLHSHPGMLHPPCEHLQLSLCSLQVACIDARGPAKQPGHCRDAPLSRLHRELLCTRPRVLMAPDLPLPHCHHLHCHHLHCHRLTAPPHCHHLTASPSQLHRLTATASLPLLHCAPPAYWSATASLPPPHCRI